MLIAFLRDPIWTFIGTIVAIALATGGIIYSQKQKSLKRITCQLISDAPVLTVESTIREKIQILFQHTRPVSDLRQVVLKLKNTGNAAITLEDYDKQIKFGFKFSFGEAEILDFEKLETIPSDLGASFTQDAGTLTLDKVLLNPQDSIKLSVLVTEYTGSLKVSGHIVGVNEILLESLEKETAKWDARREVLKKLILLTMITLIVVLIVTVIVILLQGPA